MPLAFLLAVRLALGLSYSMSVPVWEASDEDGHFAYARYLAKRGSLLQPGDPEAEKIWEKFQPPLYYLLIAPAIAGFDLSETFEAPERNPHLVYRNAGFNYALHPDHLEGTAQSTVLAVHVARVVSVLISTASVSAVYLAARRVWPTETTTAWAVTCLYAFWPQFLFTGSMITNDVLVTALAAMLFYFAVRLVADGFHLGRALTIGAILGAALLTKLNGLALLPVAALALAMSVRHTRGWNSPRLWLALATLALSIAAALWLLSSLEFVTAQILQPQTLADFLHYANPDTTGLTRSGFPLFALRHGLRTFVAAFGWGNLEPPDWLYWAWMFAAGLAVVGLSVAVLERDWSAPHTILTLAICQIGSLVALTLALAITGRNLFLVSGRYLLPTLPGVAFLMVSGWRALLPERWRPRIWKILCLWIVLVGWSIPFMTLAPAYAKPQPLRTKAAIDHPMSVFFGEDIELLGYLRPQAIVPGREFQITLCWQAVAPITRNYSVLLEVVRPDGQVYGRLESYPGRGNYATSLWAVNVPFCDSYTLRIGRNMPASSAVYVRLSLLAGVYGDKLPVKNAAGELAGQEVQIPVKVEADE